MIAHFDLDAFFASCEIRDNPKLAGKPVVVAFVTPQGNHCNRGVVSAASYPARIFGVRSGMSLWEAKNRCPALIIISGNFAKYETSSQMMYQIFTRYTPSVEPLSADEAFLDFAGCEAIYPNLIKTCLQIKADIKSEIGITCSAGLASSKVVAKIASDFQKPDGLTHIPCGLEKTFLEPLDIGKLYGVGPKSAIIFSQIGVQTIGDLASLPEQFIKEAFGKYGQTIWFWANGIDPRPVAPPGRTKSISRSTTFIKDSKDLKFLSANLLYLCEKVAWALRLEKFTGRRVTIEIRDHDFLTQSHQRISFQPIKSAKQIYEISRQLLVERWDHQTALRLIGVSVSGFDKESHQLSFFDNNDERQFLDTKLDRLREKYGFWTVHPATLLNLKALKNYPDQDQNGANLQRRLA